MENKKRLEAFFQVNGRFIQECRPAHKSSCESRAGRESEKFLRRSFASELRTYNREGLRKSVRKEGIINIVRSLAVCNETGS